MSQRTYDHQGPSPTQFTHERLGRVLAGLGVLLFTGLGVAHSPLWLVAVALTGLNLAQSGITNHCGVKSLLIRMGLPGERDLGRLEAWPRVLRQRVELEPQVRRLAGSRKAVV